MASDIRRKENGGKSSGAAQRRKRYQGKGQRSSGKRERWTSGVTTCTSLGNYPIEPATPSDDAARLQSALRHYNLALLLIIPKSEVLSMCV